MSRAAIQLHSGRIFYLDDPQPDDIEIDDIAYALSQLCRFTGHTRQFYSVAQHCIHVSELVAPHYALDGLLHDASEAFIGDISTPLKGYLGSHLRVLENELHYAIAVRFDTIYPHPAAVKQADLLALSIERRDLMVPGNDAYWNALPQPDGAATIRPMYPLHAYTAFLRRFDELKEGR